MATNNTDFNIPKDGYLAFDALTLKQFIKDRLNETGVFTDQNYEGSYISTINEVIAYTFNMLMYYLNRTSTESIFSEATIYENMNRIVKLLEYNPVGRQTSNLSFKLTAKGAIPNGLYTIPRYSYIENGAKSYSFNEDIVFAKNEPLGAAEQLTGISNEKLLYQGRFKEYPLYTAAGNDGEIVYLAPGDNVIVDHFNIDVYVKRSGAWSKWNRVPSLYLEDAFSSSFEIRFNESKRYELKFGNDINGRKLQPGDQVAIYYLQSNGSNGEIGVGGLNGKRLIPFSTARYTEIMTSLAAQTSDSFAVVDTATAAQLYFTNEVNSTYYQVDESVSDIRNNAPGIFRSQYRLITATDYESYIRTNFANLIHDVEVVNNWRYVNEQVRYFYNIGINDPNNVSNLLYNQLNFADACNFNNIYLIIVPKTVSNTKNSTTILSTAQKELIISSIRGVKTLTSETIILDPVFMGCSVGLTATGSTEISLSDIDNTELVIIPDENVRRDAASIRLSVYNVIKEYFSRSNQSLGNTLDITQLTNNILAVPGVKNIRTQRTDIPSVGFNGLSMVVWNPIYPTDITIATKNTEIEYFKYLFLNDSDEFQNKIRVASAAQVYETIEY